MDLGIEGRVALVTGGGRGLGKADCLKLAEEGAKIAVFDILGEKAEETAREISERGGQAVSFYADITDRQQVAEAIEKVKRDLGPIDILINNAARVETMAQFRNLTLEQWQKDMQVNIDGLFNVTQPVFRSMLGRNWGRIICMSSIAGMMGSYGQVSYAATKTAVIGFAKSLAIEGARKGITVNVVVPGMIATEMMRTLVEAKTRALLKRIPLEKAGEPEDIANTVAFLCSDRAKYITGAVVHVTGGLQLLRTS
ncbi:MAG: SDR family NAD(P)-dependent oxidoreductase [Desulfitobacteriaceae bacterium]